MCEGEESIMMCSVCKNLRECRLGVCFDCAESESIIYDGTDMYDNIVAKTPMEKLKQVVKRCIG